MSVRIIPPRAVRVVFGPARALSADSNLELGHFLAAIEVDEKPVGGVALSVDRSVAGRIGISLVDAGLVVATRYGLLTATDAAPNEADWLAGVVSQTRDIAYPAAVGAPVHQGNPVRFYRVAIPEVLGEMRSVIQVADGAPIGDEDRVNWTPAVGGADVTQVIGGVDCRIYSTDFAMFATVATTFRFAH